MEMTHYINNYHFNIFYCFLSLAYLFDCHKFNPNSQLTIYVIKFCYTIKNKRKKMSSINLELPIT